MPGRIGLIGGECTGKTSLAADLAARLDARVVPEHLRMFVDEHGRPPAQHEQRTLMLAQQAAEDAAAAACSLVVVDPAALMTAVYSLAYFDDPSLLALGVELARGYDLVLWCGTDVPWVPDGGQRDGPEHRDRVDGLLQSVVRDRLVPTGIEVVRVEGPPSARAAAGWRAWQRRASKTPT